MMQISTHPCARPHTVLHKLDEYKLAAIDKAKLPANLMVFGFGMDSI